MKKLGQILGLLLAASLVLSACSGETSTKKKKQEEVRQNTVKVMTLEKTTIARNLQYSTVLQAYEKVSIAPTIPGRIEKIMVEVGTKVSQGELLVKMDPTSYNQAKVAFDNLAVDFGRIAKLNESDNISKQTYDQMKAQYDAQKTSLNNLEANTFLRAPFSGVIEAKNYENGELYSGMPILSLVQMSNLKAFVNIPESYYPLVKKGMPVVITSNIYPNDTFKGEIEIVYPTIDATAHTFQVQVKIPNGKETLRPGMYVNAAISMGEEKAMIAPYQAVLKLQGSNERYVFLNDNGVAKRVSVTLGQRFDDQIELISDEIKEGDQLIILGQARLVNGVKVEVTK